MNGLKRIGMAVALAAVSAIAYSQGAAGPPTPEAQDKSAIETRQGLYKLISNQMAPIGGMLRNNVPFDAAVVDRNSARIVVLAGMIPEMFARDTRKQTATKTAALEGIWNSQADFKGKADGLVTAATALNAAAKTGDKAATLKAAADVGKACGACHDNYRAKP
jgi:cytochrome c556